MLLAFLGRLAANGFWWVNWAVKEPVVDEIAEENEDDRYGEVMFTPSSVEHGDGNGQFSEGAT
jgi:hypothetical protein